MTPRLLRAALLAGGASALAGAASAVPITVSVTNAQGEGGLYLTPLFHVFHDGGYDAFDAGGTASPGVEAIAEEGDATAELAATAGLNSGVVPGPEGFAGAPVIDPGETATATVEVDASERYFSFLSMVIPSNDSFVGNDDPLAYEVLDDAGAFTGIGPIVVTGADVWDAGTEVNDLQGAAFSTAGGTDTDEGGAIALEGDLGFLVGTPIPPGGAIGSVPGAADTLAVIEFSAPDVAPIPVPAAMPLMLAGLGALGLVARRRRRGA